MAPNCIPATRRCRSSVVKRRQPGRRHLLGDQRNTLAAHLIGCRRPTFADAVEQTAGALLHQTGRHAVFVFDDVAAARVGGLAGDPGRVQRPGVVHGGVAAAVADARRAVRYRNVEVVTVGRSAVLELGVVVHEAIHPHPRGGVGGARRHRPLDLGDGAEVDVDADQLVEAGAGRVRMGIDEAGRHRHAFGIDDHRAAADQVGDVIGAAHGAEAPMLDGERLGHRLVGLHRVDPCVDDHQVGFPTRGRVAGAGKREIVSGAPGAGL